METIQLNSQAVNAYKEILLYPEKHGMDFKPINECFEQSETVTAQHVLFNQFIALIKKPLPKIFFYLVMQEIYGHPNVQDETGCLGYHLVIKRMTNKQHIAQLPEKVRET